MKINPIIFKEIVRNMRVAQRNQKRFCTSNAAEAIHKAHQKATGKAELLVDKVLVDNIQLLFNPARLNSILIIVIQNNVNQYEILYENIQLSTLLHYINNEIALPKCAKGKKVFGDLSGKYFKDLPCIVQKSILQTNINLFMVFEKDEKKLHSEVDALIKKFTF